MIIGMDFGTTNTRAAVFDGRSMRQLPLDTASSTAHICRTSIYITREKDYYLGSTALNLYFNQNVGRPTRFRKIWVGEILQVFAELPSFYRDVYVYEDEFSPGRLFLSIKTAMRNPAYYGTAFQGSWYSISDLAAIFLLGMKLQIERHLDSATDRVVLGRPVHFSTDPTEDSVAQARLLEAAFQAGFQRVYLEYEPIAAALAYEKTIRDKETVLVFDFGGGTLDFTVMEIGVPSERRVLATGGVPIAGDVFDQRLFRATIPKHLGEGDTFVQGGVRYPIPAHIFDLLTTPQEVLSLNTPQNLENLRSIHAGSTNKKKTHALLKIVSSNYALLLFDLVERAKRQLSDQTETTLRLQTDSFTIEETINRLRFEQAIHSDAETIRAELEATLLRSGLRPRDIQRVIRTGGSSRIPLFGKLLHRMFGYDKVHEIDTFSSVTSGLAIRAHEVESGLTTLAEHTPESVSQSQQIATDQRTHEVTRVDISTVKQRLEISREARLEATRLPKEALLILGENGLRLLPFPTASAPVQIAESAQVFSSAVQVIRVDLEGQILAATDRFRLMAAPVDSLYVIQEIDPKGYRDILHLEPDESVTALMPWNPDRLDFQMVGLVTSTGQVRGFDAGLLADQMAGRPYFQLEKRYTGIPAVLLPTSGDEWIVTGTSTGRIGRAPGKDFRILVANALKTKPGEKVTAAISTSGEQDLVALSETGYFLAVQTASIPANGAPAGRGMQLRRNFPIIAFLPAPTDEPTCPLLVTDLGRLVQSKIAPGQLPTLPQPPTRMIKLGPDEAILGCVG